MPPTNSSPRLHHETTVIRSAVQSRLLVLTLIFLWRTLLSPYDTSTPINPNCLSTNPSQQNVLFPSLSSAIESRIVWDSGYEYEQTYAFFPLLPLCMSMLSSTVPNLQFVALSFPNWQFVNFEAVVLSGFSFGTIVPVIGQRAVLGLSGYVINIIGFVFAAVYLYRLSVVTLDHEAALALQAVVGGALRCICIFVPFVAFQAYAYNNICLGHLPSNMRPWCKARVALLCNYIQSHYWGVGFLRYFQVKRLPNFLLASPTLSLALCSIVHYAKSRPETFFSLGFRAPPEDKDSAAVLFSLAEYSSRSQENDNLKARNQVNKDGPALLSEERKLSAKRGYLSVAVLPCILHLGFMATTAFFVMHVQVATRFLSFCPPLYWFASYIMKSRGTGKRWGYIVWAYSAAYILLGSLLFSNSYPFT